MKQLFSKFLVAFLLTSAVVLSWSEYFYLLGMAWNREIVFVVSFLDEIFLYRTREGLFLRFLHIWYAFDNRIVTLHL